MSEFLAWVVLLAIFTAVVAVLFWDGQRYLKREHVPMIEKEDGSWVPVELGWEAAFWLLSG